MENIAYNEEGKLLNRNGYLKGEGKMKGKLVCFIGLAAGGIIGIILGERRIQSLKQENNRMDAKLEELYRQEKELLRELDAYHQKTEEEIRKTQELIGILKELEGFDPTKIDIRIDPE